MDPLKRFATPLLTPVYQKFGLARTKLLLHWQEIVGEQIGAVSRPAAFRASSAKNKREDLTLHLDVLPAYALLIQHQELHILEKINVFLGYSGVSHIKIINRFFEPEISGKKILPMRQENQNVKKLTHAIQDFVLREALEKLGTEVYTRASSRKN